MHPSRGADNQLPRPDRCHCVSVSVRPSVGGLCILGRMEKKRFEDLVALVARLRAPGGCPWDHEQTLETLRPMIVEEAYEVVEAIEDGTADELAGQLGDLLFQVVFAARIAAYTAAFDIDDVVTAIYTKIVRHQPYVFRDEEHVRSFEHKAYELDLAAVIDMLCADLAKRGLPSRRPEDPQDDAEWRQPILGTYTAPFAIGS